MKIPKRILERRRAVRVPESLVFEIGHKEQELAATTLNVSTSGALCEVDRDIPLMTKVRIDVVLPAEDSKLSGGRRVLRLRGVVVRKEKEETSGRFFVAVFFSEGSPKNKTLLKAFIDSRLKR